MKDRPPLANPGTVHQLSEKYTLPVMASSEGVQMAPMPAYVKGSGEPDVALTFPTAQALALVPAAPGPSWLAPRPATAGEEPA